MRKLILTACGLVCLAGVSYFIGTATGAGGDGNAAEDAAPATHKIGLIDLEHIFTEYDKLKILKEEHRADQLELEGRAKDKVKAIQALQQELKTFKEGTPDYSEREQRFAKATSDFDTWRKVTQKELLRKEARMVHTVYLEVQDAVDKICQHYGYTLVLRFSKSELNSADPQKLANGISQQVVYHRNRDDMTGAVLKMLNTKYGKEAPAAAGGGKKAPIRPVGGQGKRGGAQGDAE